MTVGEPEINLNTWGLKYVRKEDKRVGQGQDYSNSDKPSAVAGRRTDERDENEVSSYGRVSDSRSDREDSPSIKPTMGGLKDRLKPHGAETHGSINESAMTSEGKVRDAGTGLPRGEGASHDSGIKDSNRRAAARFHKPEAGGTPSGTPSTSLPKSKAELDLVIIKCKLLKAKDVTATHGYGSPNRYGSDNTGSAHIVDASGKKDRAPVESKTETLAKPRDDETDVTSYGEGASGNQHGGKTTHGDDSKALTPEGKLRDSDDSSGKPHGSKAGNTALGKSEDEIVHKAIELINQAYSEIDKKHDFIEETRPVRPAKRDDDDETKKADDEHPDDKNTPKDIKTEKKRMRAQGYTSAADFDKYGDY